MKIPEDLFKKWNDLKSHGDGKKIVEACEDEINEVDVSRALKSGECSDRTFEILAEFFAIKAKKLESILKKKPGIKMPG